MRRQVKPIPQQNDLVGERLGILHAGVSLLLERGVLIPGKPFKKTQIEALEAIKQYIENEDIPAAERLVGYVEIPTGIGKTALFLTLLSACIEVAEARGLEFPAIIAVSRVDLIEQTLESIAEYTPELLPKVGEYYFKKKNLHEPVLLTTYDSMMDLIKQGTIQPEHYAIQILDEAHRVLSDARQDRLENFRTNGTIDFAFTATASYDSDKTLERTHKRRIYYKPMRVAITEGELADYVQTQFFVIRVKPERGKKGKDKELDWREAENRKQVAWANAMIATFRDGKDAITGEPLINNQAAFFTANTYHADMTAERLNADPILQAHAKAKGYKGVAVSVHTNGIQPSRQVTLMKQFKRGEYIAVVGDEKFKEGFDHPPLKVIFDYQRGSLIDKAQIIGRAARKWFNLLKQRFEGAVICDSIIYQGSSDEGEDLKRLQRARLAAITAANILEGASVQSSQYRAPRKLKVGAKTSPDIIEYGNAEVQAYCSMEQIRSFVRETEELRITINEQSLISPDGRIKLSAEEQKEFQQLIVRAGSPGADRLLKLVTEGVPELGYTYSEISRLRYGGSIYIERDRFTGLCEFLEEYAATVPKEALEDKFIPFTDEMKTEFRRMRAVRGNPHKDKIYAAAVDWAERNDKTLASNFGVSNGIMQCVQQTIKQSAWDAITQGLMTLPAIKADVRDDHVLVPYTPQMQQAIQGLAKSRGNIGNQRLHKMVVEYESNHPKITPLKIGSEDIRNLIDPTRISRMNRVYKDVYDRAVLVLRAAPEIKNADAVTITSKMYKEFDRLRRELGNPGARIIRYAVEEYEERKGLPSLEMSDSLINGIIHRRATGTKANKWARIVEAMKSKLG